MRLVSCENLQPEMRLARNVYKQGCIYLRQGQDNIVRYGQRLKDLGVDYVYVNDEASKGIDIPDMVSEETRHKCQDALRQTFATIESNAPVDLSVFSAPLNQLMNEIISNKDIQINLTDISTMDEYTFGHSVSTAIYATLIGLDLNYDRRTLEDLAAGALLHDVGKVRLDSRILFKEGNLSDAEYEHIKKHPEYSYELLRFCKNLSNPAKMISYTHHERIDGTGYPRGLKGDELHEFSKIVAVADVYDALSTNRCYRAKWPNNKVVNFLIQRAGTHFDSDIVASLIKKVAIFPTGTEVMLSDNTIALVAKQNAQMPFRPIVKVIKDCEGKYIVPYFIDLEKELSIVITASQLEMEYMEAGEDYTPLA